MDANEIRLECIRIAERRHGVTPDEAVEIARKWSDFVAGTRDAEIIDAARSLGRLVNA